MQKSGRQDRFAYFSVDQRGSEGDFPNAAGLSTDRLPLRSVQYWIFRLLLTSSR